MEYDATCKFRCAREVLARLHRIAKHPDVRRRMPDVARDAIVAYVEREEKQLKLGEMTDRQVEQYLEKAPRGSKTSKMRRPRFQQD